MLTGQIAKESAIRTFARNLQLFSSTLAGSDADLRKLIDSGSVTANELRTFIEENEVELGELVSRLVTTGEVVVKHLDGIEQVLVIYPYVVEGGFTVVSKSPARALRRPLRHDPHSRTPTCVTAATRAPTGETRNDGSNAPMNMNARCAEPASQSNARGAQHAPQRAGSAYRAPVVATYDPDTAPPPLGQRGVGCL